MINGGLFCSSHTIISERKSKFGVMTQRDGSKGKVRFKGSNADLFKISVCLTIRENLTVGLEQKMLPWPKDINLTISQTKNSSKTMINDYMLNMSPPNFFYIFNIHFWEVGCMAEITIF